MEISEFNRRFLLMLDDIDTIISLLNDKGSTLFSEGEYEKATALLEKVKKIDHIQKQLMSIKSKWENLNITKEDIDDLSIDESNSRENDQIIADFPQRYIDILQMLQKGFTNKEIADSLEITVGTARNYISSLYTYIDVANRTEAIQKAVSLGILNPVVKDQDMINDILRDSDQSILINHYGISPRELEILELISHGKTNKNISDTLEISEGTVRNYVSSILRKLDARNRTDAVRKAKEFGILG